MWVPNVYSHANSQSSAILSGCVTCAAVAPLLRMSTILEPIGTSLIFIGILSSIFGAIFALLESDDGRTLGWSSVSQLGVAILPLLMDVYMQCNMEFAKQFFFSH